MEPQTEIPNSPEQNQGEPSKDSFRSIITSPRYWLNLLLPSPSGLIILLVLLESNLQPEFIIFVFILPILISFALNFYLPFLLNVYRVIYLCVPVLTLFIFWNYFSPTTSDPGLAPYFCYFPFFILLALIVLFGWLGAKAGIARGHKSMISPSPKPPALTLSSRSSST